MITSKLIIWLIVGLLAIVLVIALARLQSESRKSSAAGHKLFDHSQDRDDYQLFVGMPASQPGIWVEVTKVDTSTVTLVDNQSVSLTEVTAFFVAYPSGNLVDHWGPASLQLPEWVNGLRASGSSDDDELVPADLEDGRSIINVTFGPSTSQPSSRNHYSTTIQNISDQDVRVVKFAGYTPSGNIYRLSTVTKQFYSQNEFREWYNQPGEWIKPGESVTDPNNYGSPPVMWAYYCETREGKAFVTGGIID